MDETDKSTEPSRQELQEPDVPTSAQETPVEGSVLLPGGDTPPEGNGPVPAPQPTPQPEAELPFERLGHYQILDRIGHGGMGDVYRGYDPSLDRHVAIKVLPQKLARDKDYVRRFQAEAAAAARLDHPNIVRLDFIGQDAGHHFFAMQLVEGESLAKRLSRQPRMPADEALRIIAQCLAGLEAAHAQRLVHRDVKPGNILLQRQTNRAVLVDFGLVRVIGQSTRLTAAGTVVGTVDYMAPEQARGQTVDGRADIYSLGVLLYRVLSGRLPFEAETPTGMVFQHAYEEPLPLEEAAPDVPRPVIDIVRRMMAKSLDDRYRDCGSVLADIEAFRARRRSPDLAETADRRSPNDFKLGLVVGGKQCALTIDSHPTEGYLTGMQVIDRLSINRHFGGEGGQVLHQGQIIPIGQPVELVSSVRKMGAEYEVRLVCDGRLVFEWTGDARRLSLDAEMPALGKGTLFLSTFGSILRIHRMRLVPISGSERTFTDDRPFPLTYADAQTVSFTAPDQEQGLRLVEAGDGDCSVEQIDGKWMVRPAKCLYFQVDDSFAYDVPQDTEKRIVVDLVLFDLSPGWVSIQYDARPNGDDASGDSVASYYTRSMARLLIGSGKPVEIRIELPRARLTNRQNSWSDFRVIGAGQNWPNVFALHKVSVTRLPAEDVEPSFADAQSIRFTSPDREEGLRLVEIGNDSWFCVDQVDGKEAVRSTDKCYLYFEVADSFAYDLPSDDVDRIIVGLNVFDVGGSMRIEYDGHGGEFTGSLRRRLPGSMQWVDLQFELPQARLANRQHSRSDFRVVSEANSRFSISEVTVTRLPKEDAERPDAEDEMQQPSQMGENGEEPKAVTSSTVPID